MFSNARALVDVSCDESNKILAENLAELEVGHTIEVLWWAADGVCTNLKWYKKSRHFIRFVFVKESVVICGLQVSTVCYANHGTETNLLCHVSILTWPRAIMNLMTVDRLHSTLCASLGWKGNFLWPDILCRISCAFACMHARIQDALSWRYDPRHNINPVSVYICNDHLFLLAMCTGVWVTSSRQFPMMRSFWRHLSLLENG